MEKTTKKMLKRDVYIVLGFIVFLWVTMTFLMFSILTAIGASSAKNILIAIGVLTLLFATLSLFALIIHLRKNREDIYTEEIINSRVNSDIVSCELASEAEPSADMPKKHSHGTFVKIFDIVFIMVLCFSTLLATMLLRGKTVNGANIYSVELVSVILTVVGFTAYFRYITVHSHKELKIMVDELYADEKESLG